MVTKDKIACSCCDKTVRPEDYYASSSPFHSKHGKLHVCKQCIWDYVEKDKENLNHIKSTLRMIDRPFLRELWSSSIQETEKSKKELYKIYFKNLAMPQYRELTWDDSDFGDKKSENIYLEEEEDLTELHIKWGKYKREDLTFLENFYYDYSNSYATDTPVQINLYKSIAKVHLQAEKELANNSIKVFKDLMELSSKLHNDGNIKPIQSTGANDDKGLSTYGLWIKTVEQDEPCEYFKKRPIYEDFDKFKKYIEDWFVRPFKNIFNISKDFNVKDDD
jgi:hypothetical protein